MALLLYFVVQEFPFLCAEHHHPCQTLPLSFLVVCSEAAQVIKKDKPAFLTEEEEEEEKRRLGYDPHAPAADAAALKCPPELRCPFGDHLIREAVLVPCCGHFVCCDECVRDKISRDEVVECPRDDCDQEIGSLESITPYHNTRKLVNEFLAERRANRE